jgi:molecular chaperone GrpE
MPRKKPEDTKQKSDAGPEDVALEIPIEDETESLKERADEFFRTLQYTKADFENYRKRMESRIGEITRAANDALFLRLLDVYDNLERAAAVDFASNPQAAKDGVNAILQQINKLLASEEVRPIKSIGEQYDPYYHSSVSRLADHSRRDGIVVEEYQRGYMIREKVLRPALVCVNRHEVPAADQALSEETPITNEDMKDGER